MITQNHFLFTLTMVVILGLNLSVFGQRQSLFDQIMQEEALEITIQADFDQLVNHRNTNDYTAGNITIEKASGELFEHEIKIRPRGKFRRRICDFPPLKLKFAKQELQTAGLLKYNDFKLVTHCIDDKFSSKENVLKELLAYKVYNELTEYALRTQLVKVTYVDQTGKLGKIKRYGFLIEEIDELANRYDGEECECLNADPTLVSAKDENIMAIYQYMVGNSDWNTSLLRNIKLITKGDGSIVPVAYDFDFSGLVDAPYAIPNPDYSLVSVKQRVFIGWEVGDEIFRENILHYFEKKAAIYDLIHNFKELSKPARMEIIEYLDTFYDDLKTLSSGSQSDLYARIKASDAAPDESGNGSMMFIGGDSGGK